MLRASLIACAVFSACLAPSAQAAVTTLDGSPTVFGSIVIGDFSDTSGQGWVEAGPNHVGGLFFDGTQLQNNTGTTGADPFIVLDFVNSPLPGVPEGVTVGSLPGQYDIVQFDLRFDSLPQAAIDATTTRGDHFFILGAPAGRESYYVNDGTGMQNGDTVPELPTDGAYHTYTIQRQPSDDGWGSTFTRMRIDPINNAASIGTLFSLDNISIGRSNDVQAFPAIEANDFVENGSFDSVSNYVTNTAGNPTPNANVGGSFGDFIAFQGSNANIDNWTHFSRNGGDLETAVGTPGLIDGNGELDGTYYLDALWVAESTSYLSNSGGGYDHGLVQALSIPSEEIDPDATYELNLEYVVNQATGTGPGGGHENATVTLALTDGVGNAATDLGNAIASVTSATLDQTPTDLTIAVSGADLLAASDLNVVLSHVNMTPIPGFPGSVDPADLAPQPPILVSQVLFNDVSFAAADLVGDVNKDGLVTQDDVDLAQAYLDGDGGQIAADRQNTLIGLGNPAADVLDALNLTAFDVNDDEFFDADDVAAIAALLGGDPLQGDANGDGTVDLLDLDILGSNFGASPATLTQGDFNGDNVVDLLDLDILGSNFGAAASTSIPEPCAAWLLASAAVLAFSMRCQSYD